jgi:hypothetical protein
MKNPADRVANGGPGEHNRSFPEKISTEKWGTEK